MRTTADVIIIGGGISGCSAAYQLARRGARVRLLEKNHLAAGSTGRTVGIIRQHYSNEITARMALRSLRVWQDFANVIGGDAGFVNNGVIFAVGPHERDKMVANVTMHRSVGIRVEMLDIESLQEVTPQLNGADFGGIAYEPEGGYADGALATAAFAKRASEGGAKITQGVAVRRILTERGRVLGVETESETIHAPVVINAAGPWAAKLTAQLGTLTPAQPSRHQVAVFQQPADSALAGHPFVADFVNHFYTRGETGALTLAGSLDPREAKDVVADPDRYNETVSMDFNAEMAELTLGRLPAMAEARVGKGWVGLYTVTPDWHPIIGPLPGTEGLILAYGFSGSGFKMGPVVGEMLADLALGERECPLDPAPFRLERFAAGETFSGGYGEGGGLIG